MTSPDDQNASRTGSLTAKGAAFLEAYRATDDAGRVVLWSDVLTALGRRPEPPDEN